MNGTAVLKMLTGYNRKQHSQLKFHSVNPHQATRLTRETAPHFLPGLLALLRTTSLLKVPGRSIFQIPLPRRELFKSFQ